MQINPPSMHRPVGLATATPIELRVKGVRSSLLKSMPAGAIYVGHKTAKESDSSGSSFITIFT